MSHRHKAPILKFVGKEDSKATERKLKKLIGLRFIYGKSTFFDTDTHQPRYEIDLIGRALVRCVAVAHQCGEQFEFSVDEFRLWRQMFPGTNRANRTR